MILVNIGIDLEMVWLKGFYLVWMLNLSSCYFFLGYLMENVCCVVKIIGCFSV